MKRHLHPLLRRLAQPDDAARADANPGFLRRVNDVFLVFHRVRRADFRKIRRRRLDIAMNPRDPGLFEPHGLLLRDETERAAHFDAHLFANRFHDVQNFFKFIRIVLIAPARDERETNRAGLFRLLRGRYDFLLRQKSIHRRARLVMTGLRAEFAILGAMSAPRIDDCTKIHGVSIKFLANFIRHRQEQHRVLVLGRHKRKRLFLRNLSAVQHLLRQPDDLRARIFHPCLPFPEI